MARAGLGPEWKCLFANDIDPKKAETYAVNWGNEHLTLDDINNVTTSQLPGKVDLAWASFPCQDLSLAGDYAGLNGSRSGTFWPFWKLMCALMTENRGPRAIVLENVYGAITSNDGEDFRTIASAFYKAGYNFGAVVMDAKLWLPQSRPRLFFIGFHSDVEIPETSINELPGLWHPKALCDAVSEMQESDTERWKWWSMPSPSSRNHNFIDIIEDNPTNCKWHTKSETEYLISLMSPRNLEKLDEAIARTEENFSRMVGGVYRRTRHGRQRAEIRFDDLAGCLRTPSGGSSRQTIMLIDNGSIKSRLLSPREAARLMGLPDEYKLPNNYNQAYHVCGDGVVVPAVRFLAQNLIEPTLNINDNKSLAAAE